MTRSFALAFAALVFSGVAQATISPPLSWVWLHPVAWVPALLVFHRVSGRRAFFAGWLVGASANAAIFYWIVHTLNTFTGLSPIVGLLFLLVFALLTGFYAGVFAWGYGAVRRASGGWWPFAISAWFVGCELVNPQLFPYYQGVAWYQVPRIFLVTAFTGVSGVSFLVILVNAVIVQGIEARRSGVAAPLRRNVVVTAVLIGAALALAAWRNATLEDAPPGSSFRIGLIQSNNDVTRRLALQKAGPLAVPRDLVKLSEETLREKGPVDVLVWPETALMREPTEPRNADVLDFVRRQGVELWTGGYAWEPTPGASAAGEGDTYNAAFRITPDGHVDRRYAKTILVPFGEYIPLGGMLPILKRLEGSQNLTPGDGPRVYESPHGRFSFLICYEAIQRGYVRSAIDLNPELLVNLTYDGWYGDTSEPSQHLMLTALQAAQYGVPIVRCTTTGLTAVIDARGIITHRTDLNTRGSLIATIAPRNVPTLYARIGDVFGWGCLLAGVGMVLLGRRMSAA